MFAHRMLVIVLTVMCCAAAACDEARGGPNNPTPTPASSPSAGASKPNALPPQPTFTASAERGGGDAIGFCAKYGTVDFPARDTRYTGSPLPLQITEILRAHPPGGHGPLDYYVYSAWRCSEGHVYTCTVGGGRRAGACGYAEPADPLNDAMIAYCRQNPEASYIPDDVVGVPAKLAYQWVCGGGVPKADRRRSPVDTQGFLVNEWARLPEPES